MVIPSKEAWDLWCLPAVNNGSKEECESKPGAVVKKLSYTADQSIKVLYKKYYKSFCQHAIEKIKDAHAAQDVVADAFWKLMQEPRRLSMNEMRLRMYTYINMICIDHLRKQKVFAKVVPAFGELTPADEAEIEAELRSMLVDELQKLPVRRKQIIIQHYMHGLTSQEIAQNMQVSEQTVRNQKVKALKTLRKNIWNKLFHIE